MKRRFAAEVIGIRKVRADAGEMRPLEPEAHLRYCGDAARIRAGGESV